jgi:sensor histidine kinase regulating citrate/malate metabolism
VWNHQSIPEDIARRVFQRNFSTKEEAGRGVGTYSMKLLGEQILGGRVRFSTSPEEGTVFSFSLPL